MAAVAGPTARVAADRPAVAVDGLVKRFGKIVALGGVSFEVPAGTVLGMLGPNGAGKTTAVRVLTTILRPDAGQATVLGIDVTARPQAVRASIGLAGQFAAVDAKLTGRENLRLVGRLTRQPSAVAAARADELLEQFDLVSAADRQVGTYSGGMRRRLDLAAALVHRPPVLFLDEPTTGLDPRARTRLWDVIDELVREGTTVLLTSQYLEEVDRLADDIVVIDGGMVVAHGSATELKRRLSDTVTNIRFDTEADARRAAHLLGRIGVAEVAPGEPVLRLAVADSGAALLEIVRVLDADGPPPRALTVHEPTLDDVFLRLTGHRATPESDESDVPGADPGPAATEIPSAHLPGATEIPGPGTGSETDPENRRGAAVGGGS